MTRAATTKLGRVCTGRPGTAAGSIQAIPIPVATPSAPPASERTDASKRKRARICRGLAPRALARPISAVRSLTAIHMMVRTPTAPTTSEIPPMAPTAMLTMPRTRSSTPSMSFCVTIVKSSSPPCRSRMARATAARTVSAGTCSEKMRSISTSASLLNRRWAVAIGT